MTELNIDHLTENVIAELKTVFDPEIPVNIYELGLIYRIDVQPDGFVEIDMTLTTPMCPVAQTFPLTVQERIMQVPKVTGVKVELVWDPPWTKERLPEAVRLSLGLL